jgi:hypothetical protein
MKEVTEKSKKQDLWNAYQELVSERRKEKEEDNNQKKQERRKFMAIQRNI